jgi:hypothetical protein
MIPGYHPFLELNTQVCYRGVVTFHTRFHTISNLLHFAQCMSRIILGRQQRHFIHSQLHLVPGFFKMSRVLLGGVKQATEGQTDTPPLKSACLNLTVNPEDIAYCCNGH